MPLVYADTSALFAWFYPKDEFSNLVDRATQADAPDFVYWPWLRFELRHNLRQARGDRHGETAWSALRAAERTQARLRWQPELTAGRILESAEELSAERAPAFPCGAVDVVHVAAARRLHLLAGLDAFWTCDAAQAALAKTAGLPTRLFALKHPPAQAGP